MKDDLDAANEAVTFALINAERLAPGTPEYRAAWLAVASCEQRIADLTEPGTVEGDIARRGVASAVTRSTG